MSWKKRNFEDCLEKFKKPPKLKKSKYLREGKFPIVAQENSVINGYTDDESLVFKIDRPVLIFGDHTRRLKYVDFNFVLGADGAKIIKPKSDINAKFFFYYLTLLMPMNIGYARHYKLLKKIKFNIPSLSEQQQIVTKLDVLYAEIDKVINLTKKKMRKEKEINLSILNSIFSNIKTKKTICEIATVIAGQSPKGKYYNKNGEGIPFYQGKKEFGDYQLKKPNVWTTKTTKLALKGDVLLSVRAPVGETNMCYDKICIGRGLAAIRANKQNNSEYIYYFLNSIKDRIVGNAGAVFNSINKKQIEDILIPIPNLDEQNQIINKIKLILLEIKKMNLLTKQKLHNLNILKLSILNKELMNKAA
ncbi:restriction endonuclease subunit S [Candidatus Pelagibacter sp.]|nr:restriction endonuclease subunit S [Candidatus Pelagibacter sp.]